MQARRKVCSALQETRKPLMLWRKSSLSTAEGAVYYYYQLYIYLYLLKKEVARIVDKTTLALQAKAKDVVCSIDERFGRKSRGRARCQSWKQGGVPALECENVTTPDCAGKANREHANTIDNGNETLC